MRVSEYFKLNRSQPTLDFVDVDITDDLPLFIDPRALRLLVNARSGFTTAISRYNEKMRQGFGLVAGCFHPYPVGSVADPVTAGCESGRCMSLIKDITRSS